MADNSTDFSVENQEKLKKLMAHYRCAIMEIETKFRVLDEEFSLRHDRNPISSVSTRLKSHESLIEKMKRKGLAVTAENIENNINDVAGVRVVCPFTDDVYVLAKALTRQNDIDVIRIKDYIENPKENGYRSLHIIVAVPIFLADETRKMRVEVQLRTIAMDFWASLEHQLRYKKEIQNEEISGELKSCAEISADLDRRMNSLRNSIIQ
ncbi:MAG: GTP pyrophosphokinase family protein [Clostridia bacterium]|nr:GTP pyrophosphokinase family protein [Clostridia bacterium]